MTGPPLLDEALPQPVFGRTERTLISGAGRRVNLFQVPTSVTGSRLPSIAIHINNVKPRLMSREWAEEWSNSRGKWQSLPLASKQ